MAIARYTFLPWLRRGIANRIQAGAGAGASRATLTVALSARSDVSSTPIPPVTVRLVGPGDITSVHPHQVIRTEPRALVTDFESNYLAAVDFYDEDFAWRYSPIPPEGATHRLTPWLALIVLKDDEFTRVEQPGRPLSSFNLTAKARRADVFPVLGQEWAWAHVHLNHALAGTPPAPDLGALSAAVRFVRRRWLRVLVLYLLNVAGAALVFAIWALIAPSADAPVWLALLLTQVYLMLRLWTKLVFLASATVFLQGELAHAHYTAAPMPVWPDSPAADAIR